LSQGKKDKEKEWTPEEIKSAIAWKDGFNVIALKSPYRRGIDEKSFHISKVPKGLAVLDLKGKGSQQRSARAIGKLPKKLTVDVGFEDVTFTQRGRKLTMRHTRDTRGTISQLTIKRGRSLSKKRGRVFHTKIAGGNVISRRQIRGY